MTQLQHYFDKVIGCTLKWPTASDYRDFAEQLVVGDFDLALTSANSVNAIAERLPCKPLVATQRLFRAQLIAYESIASEILPTALIGESIYVTDVLSGTYAALVSWLEVHNMRYRVKIVPSSASDVLLQTVLNHHARFAVVVDSFVEQLPSNQYTA